jgi:NurA-like 5'-3' nuclease
MSVVAYALELRDLIRSLIDVRPEPCEFNWLPLPEPRRPVAYSVEDGGQGDRKLRTYTVFALKAWGAGFVDGEAPRSFQEGFVGVVVPQGLEQDQRMRRYRQVLELEVALKSMVPGGLVLFDGTPPMRWGRVGAKATWEESLEAAARHIIKHRGALEGLTKGTCSTPDVDCLAEVLEGATRRPLSARALMRLVREGALGIGNSLRDYYPILALESLERLLLFRRVIEAAWSRGSTPVFVVKTSRSTSFCGGSLPDVHLVEATLRARGSFEPGYAVANVYNSVYDYFGLSKRERSMYPDVGGLRDFYENRLAVASAFVRLRAGGFIFKVEVLYDRSAGAGDPAGLLREVVSRLSSLPLTSEGYPLPLVVADSNSRVARAEMEAAMRALGLDLTPESRSMLRV